MLRKILGVIGGYVFIVAFIMGTFSALYAVLGTERSYQANSYEVSMTWILSTFVLGFIAAIGAGWLCFLISRSRGAVQVFAGIILAVGLIMAVAGMFVEKPDTKREGPVSNTEAMQKSVTPTWVAMVNPIMGAIGILIGGALKKED